MEILEEKRKIEQIPIYDEDGRISYYKIPNYTKRKEFLTANERKFMKELIKAIKTLNEKYILYNINNGEILACIELDDDTHENEERKKRDIILEKMFKETINIIHFKSKNEYTESEILNKLKG